MKGTIEAEWAIISICLPGAEPKAAGILLLDRHSKALRVKLKSNLDLPEEVRMIWEELPAELDLRVAEGGADQVADWLMNSLSHVFRLSDLACLEPQVALTEALNVLYEKYVEQRIPQPSIAAPD